MLPQEIESSSFAIIDQEAGNHGFAPDAWTIVRRMIHTTADFDYIRMARIHPLAIGAGVEAIRAGRAIITDTRMAQAGIRKSGLEGFGCLVTCFMPDPEVARGAVSRGTTRAVAAVEKAAPLMKEGIYVVGNAPTALLRLLELMDAGQAAPALVVGLPVGFVNAAESKQALWDRGAPCITNQGRKGGSNVAAAVINALALLAVKGIDS